MTDAVTVYMQACTYRYSIHCISYVSVCLVAVTSTAVINQPSAQKPQVVTTTTAGTYYICSYNY